MSERSVVALQVFKEALRLFGSCTKVPVTKDFIHAVKHAHSEYDLFLENQCKQAVLEEEEEKKKKELKRLRELIR